MSQREAEAVAVLVAAKDAYRNNPTDENKVRKAEAVRAVEEIRNEERAHRPGVMVRAEWNEED